MVKIVNMSIGLNLNLLFSKKTAPKPSTNEQDDEVPGTGIRCDQTAPDVVRCSRR